MLLQNDVLDCGYTLQKQINNSKHRPREITEKIMKFFLKDLNQN